MTDAPDRIWAEEIGTATKGGQSFRIGRWITDETASHPHEYIRADVASADAELAVAEAIRRAAEAGQEIAKAARAKAMAEKLGSNTSNDMMERSWGAENAVRAILALAPTDALAEAQRLREERDELKQKLISPDPYEDTAHFDDHSVNRFAAVMKGKLASKRLQGRGGWQAPEVPNGYLSRLLREHVDKGDPVDVANFAMMIHQRGERIAPENEGASCKAIDKAEAERDAALARVEKLREAAARVHDSYWNSTDGVILGMYDLGEALRYAALDEDARHG